MRLWLTPRWRHSSRIDVPSKPRSANASSRRSSRTSCSMTSGRIGLVRREHRRLQAADEHQPEPEAAAPITAQTRRCSSARRRASAVVLAASHAASIRWTSATPTDAHQEHGEAARPRRAAASPCGSRSARRSTGHGEGTGIQSARLASAWARRSVAAFTFTGRATCAGNTSCGRGRSPPSLHHARRCAGRADGDGRGVGIGGEVVAVRGGQRALREFVEPARPRIGVVAVGERAVGLVALVSLLAASRPRR